MSKLKICSILSEPNEGINGKGIGLPSMDVILTNKEEAFIAESVLERIGHGTDILIVDMEALDHNYIDLFNKSLCRYPHLSIIVITCESEFLDMETLIRSGVKGCLYWEEVEQILSSTIDGVLEGRYIFPKCMPIQHSSNLFHSTKNKASYLLPDLCC